MFGVLYGLLVTIVSATLGVVFAHYLIKVNFDIFIFKGTVSVISSDLPCEEGYARVTTAPSKSVCVRLVVVQRYVCVVSSS